MPAPSGSCAGSRARCPDCCRLHCGDVWRRADAVPPHACSDKGGLGLSQGLRSKVVSKGSLLKYPLPTIQVSMACQLGEPSGDWVSRRAGPAPLEPMHAPMMPPLPARMRMLAHQ